MRRRVDGAASAVRQALIVEVCWLLDSYADGLSGCPWRRDLEDLQRGRAVIVPSWKVAGLTGIPASPQTWWRLTETDELVQVDRDDDGEWVPAR